MNYNLLKYILCLAIFIFSWLFGSRNLDLHNTVLSILDTNEPYSGYNSMLRLGTINALLFFILLPPLPKVQLLIRRSRQQSLTCHIIRYSWISLAFTSLFIGSSLLLNRYRFSHAILSSTHFYRSMMLYAVIMFLFYLWLGLVFLIISLLLKTHTQALSISFLFSALMTYGGLFLFLPSPIRSFEILDTFIKASGAVNLIGYSLILANLITLSIGTALIASLLFNRKDFLNESD